MEPYTKPLFTCWSCDSANLRLSGFQYICRECGHAKDQAEALQELTQRSKLIAASSPLALQRETDDENDAKDHRGKKE